jgi:ferredoxin/flavodoxin---NADP+ reductase
VTGATNAVIHVAIVGSGPSGFYAAEALLEGGLPIQVDMFERLPAPFGLVRYGVAPDHQKLKQVTDVFEQIAEHPRFAFHGNVEIGTDLNLADLRSHYHAVIVCCGAAGDRRLGIPGEDLQGIHGASEFVGWYNGHPDFQHLDFDLSHEALVVVGNGNVALDVCRIFGKTLDELRASDITERALEQLATSRVREIHLVGRRGPAQARFTTKELREFGALADCTPVAATDDLALAATCWRELESPNQAAASRNLKVLRQFTAPSGQARRCFFRFFLSPREAVGSERLEQVIFDRTRLEGAAFEQRATPTGETVALDAGLLFRSVGYRGAPVAGLPFDSCRGIIPNRNGRIVDAAGRPQPGLYVAGWIKRGPSGTIGANRACAAETAGAIFSDLSAQLRPRPGRNALRGPLAGRSVVTMDGWRRIDLLERRLGVPKGKPREKLTTSAAMLAAARVS